MTELADVKIAVGERHRLAFRFDPTVIRKHVPAGVVGSYLLLQDAKPIYVGRSDTCLRHRLQQHPLLGLASHVAWEVTKSAERAFLVEAGWFHEIKEGQQALNQIHPAKPNGSMIECPFCGPTLQEERALAHAMDIRSAENLKCRVGSKPITQLRPLTVVIENIGEGEKERN
jgi:hypothetical protein